MYKMTKWFFTEKGAKKFAENLEAQGIGTELWTDRDGFGQKVYIIEWWIERKEA